MDSIEYRVRRDKGEAEYSLMSGYGHKFYFTTCPRTTICDETVYCGSHCSQFELNPHIVILHCTGRRICLGEHVANNT